jgi:hypothetical protein
MSETRLYFPCPNTRRWFSATFEKVPANGSIRGLFQVQCRYCESVHRYKGAEVRRSRPASQPNTKLGQKAKPKGFRVATRPLSLASPKLKDPCYGRLSDTDQKQAAAAQLSSTQFMLERKLRCVDCGQFVGAKKRIEGGFEPDPRPHERYKEPRQPPRKPSPRK